MRLGVSQDRFYSSDSRVLRKMAEALMGNGSAAVQAATAPASSSLAQFHFKALKAFWQYAFACCVRSVTWLLGPVVLFVSWPAPDGVRAQSFEFIPAVRVTGFADAAIQGDYSSDPALSGRLDAFLTLKNIWRGGTLKAQFEYVDGDEFLGLGAGGVIFPTNVYSAEPRIMTTNNYTLSLWFTQQLDANQSLGFGRWNVFDLADHNALSGGRGKGGFQYTGIATPISFVFPPYYLGGQYSYDAERVSYSLFVYDANSASGKEYWENPFQDGVNFNGTATYKANLLGLPGFYGINLIWSTKPGTAYSEIPAVTDPIDFPIEGFFAETDGTGFAQLKFQQYLAYDQSKPNEGWGVFGQLGFGSEGNPLEQLLVIGVAGSSPIEDRGEDRWGVAFAHYNWQDGLIRLAADEGFNYRNEWGMEGFYEARITDEFRFGGNVQYIRPGVSSASDVITFGLRARTTFDGRKYFGRP